MIKCTIRNVDFASSAAIPRLYRVKYKRDFFNDIYELAKSLRECSIDDYYLEIAENIAYLMAWHANQNIPNNIEDWLRQFDTREIWYIIGEILKMKGMLDG